MKNGPHYYSDQEVVLIRKYLEEAMDKLNLNVDLHVEKMVGPSDRIDGIVVQANEKEMIGIYTGVDGVSKLVRHVVDNVFYMVKQWNVLNTNKCVKVIVAPYTYGLDFVRYGTGYIYEHTVAKSTTTLMTNHTS